MALSGKSHEKKVLSTGIVKVQVSISARARMRTDSGGMNCFRRSKLLASGLRPYVVGDARTRCAEQRLQCTHNPSHQNDNDDEQPQDDGRGNIRMAGREPCQPYCNNVFSKTQPDVGEWLRRGCNGSAYRCLSSMRGQRNNSA